MPQKMLAEMTDAEFRDRVERIARAFAGRSFSAANPGAAGARVLAHAERHWREHVGRALDVVAVCELMEGDRRAAPGN